MINPAQAIAILQQARNVASGLYRAGAGMPKYELYMQLFKAATSVDPPLPPHKEDFVNFLVRAKILMQPDDFKAVIADNVEYIYMAQNVITGTGKDLREPLATNELPNIMAETERRYQEFCDAYEKVSSKGYPVAAATVARQIVPNPPSQSASKPEVSAVSIDIFRKNFAELISPEKPPKKKKETEEREDKEINIEKGAKTDRLDTKPIPVRVNQQTIYIAPRRMQRANNLKDNIDARAKAAAKEASVAQEPLSGENAARINAGISHFLLVKESHKNNQFIIKNLKKVAPFSNPTYMPPMFRALPLESSTHMLAIIAIISNNSNSNPKIEKGMNISRMVAVGQANQCFINPPGKPQPSSFHAMNSMEDIEKAIKGALGEGPESKQLIETMKKLQALNPNMRIGDLFDMYMQAVMFPSDVHGNKIPGKTPLESVTELCEADATALEYVAKISETFNKAQEYLLVEGNRLGQSSPEGILLNANLGMLYKGKPVNVQSLTPREAMASKHRGDSDASSDAEQDLAELPLTAFSRKLQARVEKKNEESALKTVTRAFKRRNDIATLKKEQVEDALSDARIMVEESLMPALAGGVDSHKTRQSEAQHAGNLTAFEINTELLAGKRNTLQDLENQSGDLVLKQVNLANDLLTLSQNSKPDPAEIKRRNDEINGLKNQIINLDEEMKKLENEIDQLEDSVKRTEDKIEAYLDSELLENPEAIVTEICKRMNDARVRDAAGNIIESDNETETQKLLFQEFVDALRATPPEGKALAEYVRDQVIPELNKGVQSDKKIVVNVRSPSNSPVVTSAKLTQSPAPQAASTLSPTTSNFSQFNIRLPENQVDNFELNPQLVKERAQLIVQVEALLKDKAKSNPTKAAQLQEAISYLTGENEFYQKDSQTVERKYATAAASAASSPNPQDKEAQKEALTSIMTKRSIIGSLTGGPDRTTTLLQEVKNHAEKVQKEHAPTAGNKQKFN